MKIVKKNVYYCEFCKKRSLSRSSMFLHEKHCTKNINRACRLCGAGSGIVKTTVEGFQKQYPAISDKKFNGIDIYEPMPISVLEKIKAENGCPLCILSVLRQCNYHEFENENGERIQYDWKTESANYYADNTKECYWEY